MFRRLIGTIPIVGYEWLVRRDVVGLCYHLVSDECPPHVAHLGAFKPLEMFEADLKYLKQHYKVISYEELLRIRQTATRHSTLAARQSTLATRHRPLTTRPAVILTFDDGFRECFTKVRPLLLKYKLPAIFFITTDFIDNRRLFYRNKVSLCLEKLRGLSRDKQAELTAKISEPAIPSGFGPLAPDTLPTWLKKLPITAEAIIDKVCEYLNIDCERYLTDQQPYLTSDEIKALAADGFTIGAHSKSHQRLGREKGSGPICVHHPEARSGKLDLTPFHEIADSCRIIAELTGSDRVPFAFPFSGDGVDREQLTQLRRQCPEVDLIFDRRGFQADADFIVHRIIGDNAEQTIPARSNVNALIRRAYCHELTGVK